MTDPLFFDVVVTSAPIGVYQCKEALKAAGWDVVSSGDGNALYGASSDVITSGNSGANGMANTRSWFILRSPGLVTAAFRFLCIQNVTASGNSNTVRIKYSLTGWTGGSPDANTVPSIAGAESEAVVYGSGTDASPNGANGFVSRGDPGSLTTNLAGFADQAAPYGFCFWMYQNESGGEMNLTSKPRFMLDPLLGRPDGTVDDDPYVVHFEGTATSGAVWERANLADAGSNKGLARQQNGTYSRVNALYFSGTISNEFPPNSPIDPWTAKYSLLPVLYGSAAAGIKGISTLLHQVAQAQLSNTNRDRIFSTDEDVKGYWWLGNYAVPWSGVDPASGTWTTLDAEIWDVDSILAEDGDEGPAVENLSPAAATELEKNSIIEFDFIDEHGILDVIITCLFEGERDALLVHDDEGFRGRWDPGNGSACEVEVTETDIDGNPTEMHFAIRPLGGWRKAIEQLKINGYDLFGNKEVDSGNVVEDDDGGLGQ